MRSFVVPSRTRVHGGRLVIADGAVSPNFIPMSDESKENFSGGVRRGRRSGGAACDPERCVEPAHRQAAWNSSKTAPG